MTAAKDTSTVSRAEFDTLARSLEAIKQSISQSNLDAQSLDTTRQTSDTALAADVGVSLHENPDEKSTTEGTLKAGAGRIAAASASAIEDTLNFRRKLDDAYLSMLQDERTHKRETHARLVRSGSQHDVASLREVARDFTTDAQEETDESGS